MLDYSTCCHVLGDATDLYMFIKEISCARGWNEELGIRSSTVTRIRDFFVLVL